jgi:lipopolysaccharide transport system permease protein
MIGYLAAIWRCRYFWMSLVKVDLRTRYRRSVIGLGWSLLHPISMTIIFCIVFRRLFQSDTDKYAPYLMSGLVFWNYFQTATLLGCNCFYQAESYIRQYPSPLAIFPLRTALGTGIHFLLALLVALVLSCYLIGVPGPLALLSLAPTLVLVFLLVWSTALLAGFATVLFQDTEHLCTVGFQILFYATPLLYNEEMFRHSRMGLVLRCNPLVPFLKLFREPLLEGRVPSWHTYATAAGFVLLVGGLAGLVLNRIQRRFIFYL